MSTSTVLDYAVPPSISDAQLNAIKAFVGFTNMYSQVPNSCSDSSSMRSCNLNNDCSWNSTTNLCETSPTCGTLTNQDDCSKYTKCQFTSDNTCINSPRGYFTEKYL